MTPASVLDIADLPGLPRLDVGACDGSDVGCEDYGSIDERIEIERHRAGEGLGDLRGLDNSGIEQIICCPGLELCGGRYCRGDGAARGDGVCAARQAGAAGERCHRTGAGDRGIGRIGRGPLRREHLPRCTGGDDRPAARPAIEQIALRRTENVEQGGREDRVAGNGGELALRVIGDGRHHGR